jgi:outer membrane protein assembly factor BamB
MAKILFVCGLAVWMFGAVGAPGVAEWPRFRGPNGNGIADDARVPVQWTESGILWKTAIPGAGNSSPIVSGGRVFLQSASADGTSRFLLCLDTSTGRVLWSRTSPGSRAPMHARNTLASSTPATDGRRVYALFWDGAKLSLGAFDFSGTHLWTRDLGVFNSQHGAGASPIVVGDKVILYNDQDTSSLLVAVRAATGEIAWSTPRKPFVACYSSPFLLERPGEAAQLVVGSTTGISGYDPDTGRERWNWNWAFHGKPLRTVASPVYGGDHIFLTSGDGGGDRHMVAVKIEGKGESVKTSLAWESRRTFPYVPTMLTWGGHLYWVSDLGIAGCNMLQTGETVWTERLGGNFTASPVLAAGRIYATSEEGEIHVFSAAPRFRSLATNSIGELVRASPAISNGRIFIRGSDHLFCIGEPAAVRSPETTQHEGLEGRE